MMHNCTIRADNQFPFVAILELYLHGTPLNYIISTFHKSQPRGLTI